MWKMAMAAVMAFAGAVSAEPIDGKAAKKLLFSPRGIDVQVPGDSGLTEVQRTYVQALAKSGEFRNAVSYYGALALSPSFFVRLERDGNSAALSGLFQITSGHHSPRAAEASALGACNAARASGDAACVIAARVLPKRWKEKGFGLSAPATEAFKVYRKGNGPKALAISAATVAYAIAKGEGAAEAALASCNKNASQTGAPDCTVVVAD